MTKDGKTLLLCGSHCIPNSVTTIGKGAFREDKSIQSIVMPNSVTKIDDGAFSDCTSLQSIVIPDGVTTIGTRAFIRCDNLQSIEIPDSVTLIGIDVFQGCRSLQSITITTKNKVPCLVHENIKHLLRSISKDLDNLEISLRVPIGCGYAYRHYTAFEGKFKNIIADIDA